MAMTDTGGAGTNATEPESSDSLRTFGAVVQALREHAGLSRGDFAPLVGYSKHTVASIELGRRMPDDDFVERAEAALGNTGGAAAGSAAPLAPAGAGGVVPEVGAAGGGGEQSLHV